ncbi:MAG: hypothetical protein IPK32_08985 [Verrucomicrobiaceae bacterium]|nr:hypothetical protein [Verrucomicrobiaceae bacterium]
MNVTSLGGDVSIRQAATLSTNSVESSLLAQWNSEMLLLGTGSSSAAAYQPWLRLAETDVSAFQTVSTLMPGTLKATAFSGDIQLTGRMNLSPSATGTLELLAAGGVHGLTPRGIQLHHQWKTDHRVGLSYRQSLRCKSGIHSRSSGTLRLLPDIL